MGNQVAGVLLAAGQGKRMGTPKALVELGGPGSSTAGPSCCATAGPIRCSW